MADAPCARASRPATGALYAATLSVSAESCGCCVRDREWRHVIHTHATGVSAPTVHLAGSCARSAPYPCYRLINRHHRDNRGERESQAHHQMLVPPFPAHSQFFAGRCALRRRVIFSNRLPPRTASEARLLAFTRGLFITRLHQPCSPPSSHRIGILISQMVKRVPFCPRKRVSGGQPVGGAQSSSVKSLGAKPIRMRAGPLHCTGDGRPPTGQWSIRRVRAWWTCR